MKRKVLPTLIVVSSLFIVNEVNAQLTVKNDAYVYVGNEVLFVKQDINLDVTNSSIYLRKEGQLLQGTVANSTNKGAGKLSVYRFGIGNTYDFTSWSMPVGASTGTGNAAAIIDQTLNRPTTVTDGVLANILDWSVHNGTASPLGYSARFIATYAASDGSYNNWYYPFATGNSKSVAPGYGFVMKGTVGTDATNPGELLANKESDARQRVEFKGRPNDGTINIPGGAVGNWVFLGNPYPSALSINQFIKDNAAILGGNSVYFYEHQNTNSHYLREYQSGYGVYTANGATVNDAGTYTRPTMSSVSNSGEFLSPVAYTGSSPLTMGPFIPVGQGFWVETKVANQNYVFKNSQRAFFKSSEFNSSDVMFKKPMEGKGANQRSSASTNFDAVPNLHDVDYTQVSKLPIPQVRLNVVNTAINTELALCFKDNSLDAFEPENDFKYDYSAEANSFFVQQGTDALITSVAPFDIDKRIKIGVKTQAAGPVTFIASQMVNFDLADEVYLYDAQTFKYHDITNRAVEVQVEQGVTLDRFEVTFRKTNLSNDVFVADAFTVLQNNNTKNLTIENPDMLDITSCEMYSITGKLVLNKKDLGTKSHYEFSTNSLADGVYVVKLNSTSNRSINKKVIVKN
ncbi:MAG: T9SS type A sorting domain-containing protein [Flavobacterium sp.]|nr:T9SS type A sorting domain-containing protein [Candidatus Neoflavobacterium equi]